MSASNPIHRKQNVLRFALYGLKNSGKTCILAALAMKRQKHPKGLTCTRMRTLDGLQRPEGNPDQWDVSIRNDAFFIGQEYIDKAIERLETGDVPAPTPNFSSPLVYLFEFSAPGQWSFVIELYDYSGELVDPNLTHSALARNLRGHLREMDGLLILAEAPFPDRDMEPLTKNLHKLEEAFTTLKKETEDKSEWAKPIALILNKWDRRSPIQYHKPEEEDAELTEFLDARGNDSQFLPYGGLVDKLKNSVGDGDFRAFAVSAFGDHRMSTNANTELPARVNPLPAFGLEDPFVWAARRCTERRVQQVEEISRRFDFNLRRARQAKKDGVWLCRHLPKGTEERSRVKSVLRRARLSLMAQFLALVSVMVLSVLIAECTYDGVKYRSISATYNDSAATQDALASADRWLHDYFNAPWYMHTFSQWFVLPRDTAASKLQEIQSDRESKVWASVEQTEELDLKADLAKKYMEHYGKNGGYRNSAENIIALQEQEIQRDANAMHLKGVETEFEAYKRSGIIQKDELDKLKSAASNFPHSGSTKPELLQQRDQLVGEISKEIVELARKKGLEEWARFVEDYESLLLAGDIVAAHDKLEQGPKDGQDIQKLRESFPARAIDGLTKAVREKAGSRLWKPAYALLDKVNSSSALIGSYGDRLKMPINELKSEIDSQYDKSLYDDVISQKTPDAAKAYLSMAPLQPMKVNVQEYINYINSMNGPITCKLSLESVEWSENIGDGYNAQVSVSVDSKVLIDRAVTTKPLNRSGKVGDGPLSGNLKDRVNLHIKIVREDGYLTNGEAVYDGESLSKELKALDGFRIALKDKDGNTNFANFKLLDVPKEPTLPEWTNK